MDIETGGVNDKGLKPPVEPPADTSVPANAPAKAKRSDNLSAKRPTGALGTVHMVFFVVIVVAMTVVYGWLAFVMVIVSRKLARKIARMWNQNVLDVGGVKVKVTGREKLDKNERYVFMSNHQSALDIPIIYTGIGENICFIAKKELFRIPFFGWGMSSIGHISIDRENARKAHASIMKAAQKLGKEHISLILFPEGTRSKDGKVLDFKPASFTLALHAGVRLVPVAIKGAIDRLPPKSSRIIPGEVELKIGDPIGLDEIKGVSKGDICRRVHGVIKEMAEGA